MAFLVRNSRVLREKWKCFTWEMNLFLAGRDTSRSERRAFVAERLWVLEASSLCEGLFLTAVAPFGPGRNNLDFVLRSYDSLRLTLVNETA